MEHSCEKLSQKLIQEAMSVLSGKWKLQIITFLINNSKTRFMEIQRGVSGISSKILSEELQHMERNGIVDRWVSDPKLTVVEYELTSKGLALKSLLVTLTDWATRHKKESLKQ